MKVEYGIMSNKWSVNTEYVDGENIKADKNGISLKAESLLR